MKFASPEEKAYACQVVGASTEEQVAQILNHDEDEIFEVQEKSE